MASRRLRTVWRKQWGYSTATGRSRAIHKLNLDASGYFLLLYDRGHPLSVNARMKLLMQWRCGYMASTEKVVIEGVHHSNYRIQLITREEGERLLESGDGWKLCRQCHYEELMSAGVRARNAARLSILTSVTPEQQEELYGDVRGVKRRAPVGRFGQGSGGTLTGGGAPTR